MRVFGVAACLVVAGAAHATPAPKPAVVKAWVGTFDPQIARKPCTADCDKLVPTPHGGVVIVLSPGDGSAAATGDVVIVHPLLGAIAAGHIDHGRVTLAQFSFDPNRDGDDGVLVLPGQAAKVVELSKADVAAIRATLLRDEALAGVRKALSGLEVGAVDLDGDGKADFAMTYGCNGWADGACQSRGQFFLAHRAGRWVEIE